MDSDRNPIDPAFFMSRWLSHSHTFFSAWGEFYPSLEDMAMITGLPMFCTFHTVDALDAKGKKLVEDLRDAILRPMYTSKQRIPFLGHVFQRWSWTE